MSPTHVRWYDDEYEIDGHMLHIEDLITRYIGSGVTVEDLNRHLRVDDYDNNRMYLEGPFDAMIQCYDWGSLN